MKNILEYDLSNSKNYASSQTSMSLPIWLDNHIFDVLGAKYYRSNSDMTVIDWDKSDILNYLGTYFPRSYVESYCIFKDYFECYKLDCMSKEEISIFDFGCGTGGEIIGLLSAIIEQFENLKLINIVALDGNKHSLRLYENVLEKLQSQLQMQINNRVVPIEIDDFYDLSVIENVISTQFDIIISFKAICEFVTKQRFEQDNPYEHIANTFLPKLTDKGIMLLVDVTTYNDVSQEWLPKMIDKGLMDVKCKIVCRNTGYNQTFSISHSKKQNDVSKIAWRIIKKAE
jgi:SAM-dependent methyltransferase